MAWEFSSFHLATSTHTTTLNDGKTANVALYPKTTSIIKVMSSTLSDSSSASSSASSIPVYTPPNSGGLSPAMVAVIIIGVGGTIFLIALQVLLTRHAKHKLERLSRTTDCEPDMLPRYPRISREVTEVGGTLPTYEEAQRTARVVDEDSAILESEGARRARRQMELRVIFGGRREGVVEEEPNHLRTEISPREEALDTERLHPVRYASKAMSI